MKKDNCSVQEALEKIRDEIVKLHTQGPKEYQTNRAMNEYFEKAIIGQDWAKTILSQCSADSMSWDFQKLYTNLVAAYMYQKKHEEGRKKT